MLVRRDSSLALATKLGELKNTAINFRIGKCAEVDE